MDGFLISLLFWHDFSSRTLVCEIHNNIKFHAKLYLFEEMIIFILVLFNVLAIFKKAEERGNYPMHIFRHLSIVLEPAGHYCGH